MSKPLTLTGFSRYMQKALNGGSRSWQLQNPANLRETLPGEFVSATSAEVNAIIAGLEGDGLLKLRHTTLKQRADFIRAWCAVYADHKAQIVARASSENARTPAWYDIEGGRMLTQAKATADAAESGNWQLPMILTSGGTPVTPDIRRIMVPYGTCATWGPTNFDHAFGSVSGGNTWSAIMAGNPVLCVANRGMAGTNELMFRTLEIAAEQTGFPLEALAFAQCDNLELARQIVRGVDIVGFTGGLAFGLALEQEALANHTEFRGEMSGPNGIYVFPSTFADEGWKTALDGAFGALCAKGDFCTSFGFIVVPNEFADKVVGHLVPQANASQLVQMLSLNGAVGYAKRVDEYRQAGISWVGQTQQEPDLTARAAAKVMIGRVDAGHFLSVCAKHNLADQPFGPSTVVIGVDDVSQFAAVAKVLGGTLVSTIWSTSPEEVAEHDDLIFEIERRAGRRQRGRGKVGQGVRVGRPQCHGGMRPAASTAAFTSVSPQEAIYQFCYPACYETEGDGMRPSSLQDANSNGLFRWVDGTWTTNPVPAKPATT